MPARKPNSMEKEETVYRGWREEALRHSGSHLPLMYVLFFVLDSEARIESQRTVELIDAMVDGEKIRDHF